MNNTLTSGLRVGRQHLQNPPDVHRLARKVLDHMQVDEGFSDLLYTEPLVLELVQRVLQHAPPGGRVLLVGGNAYLGDMLDESGLSLDRWLLGDTALSGRYDRVGQKLPARTTPELLDQGQMPVGGPYDMIILPLVLEHLRTSPDLLLGRLGQLLATDGCVVLATANLGRLGSRIRALFGKGIADDWKNGQTKAPGGWPALRPYRFYLPNELIYWCEVAGYGVLEWTRVLGQQVSLRAGSHSMVHNLLVKSKHIVEELVPGLRDYTLMTLRLGAGPQPLPSLTVGGGKPADGSVDPVAPMVSIVLPSRNRAPLLRQALQALFRQTYPPDRHEIIVIDDGSNDDTPAVIAEMAPQARCRFRNVRTEGIGATAARNLGMRLAEGEIVAHIDDDAFATPRWLEEGVSGFERNVAVVSGSIRLRPEERAPFFSTSMQYPTDEELYPTANVFYRRAVALAEGGFDESFGLNMLGRPVWGWDSDLGWRVRRRGYEARFRPGALAYAHVFPLSPLQWVREGWRLSMLAGVVGAVPELRSRVLVGGLFSPYGVKFKVGLVGTLLALTQRRGLWLLAWGPWLQFVLGLMRHDWWPPRRWLGLAVKLAFMFAHHTVLNVALIHGSIRARRPAL